MDIKSGQLSTLLLDVEKVRRRKVVDYKSEQDIKYIDLADNLKTLNISNNHLIFGRRGSGKTTLILASVKRNDNIVTAIDVQSMKNDNSLNIIIKIILQVLFDVQENFRGYFNKIETKYKIQYKGVRGFGCWLLRKRDKEIKVRYEEGKKYLELLKKEIDLISLAKQEIMKCTNRDLNKISAVKAQASSGTTFDVGNSFIALLAFVASSFSLLATLLKPDWEFQMFSAYIGIAFLGLIIYVMIGFGHWRYRMEWHAYVTLAAEQLLDAEKEKSTNRMIELFEEINSGLKEIAKQEQVTQNFLQTIINEEKETRESNKRVLESVDTMAKFVLGENEKR